MELTQKKCKSCEGNESPLSLEEANKLFEQISSWDLKDEHVYKKFKFKNFKEAMEFVNKIANIAEQEGHHPDISIHWNIVEIELWTHAIKGLSENDFILAAKIDELPS